MQKLMLILSVALTALVGLAGYPVLARSYSTDEFALITVLLFLNGFFGVFDIVKPAMIRQLALREGRLGVRAYFLLSSKIAFFVAAIVLSIFNFAFSHYVDFEGAFYIALSFFIFMLYSVLWAAFEVKRKVGFASLIRAVGFTFFMFGLVVGGFFDIEISPVFVFLVSHVLIGVAFIYFGRFFVVFASDDDEKIVFRDFLLTAPQNLSKVIIDFSDRALISIQGSPLLAAAYNAIYDVSAKSNVFSQSFVAYNYPRLCRGESLCSFVNVGLFVSIFLGVVAIGLLPFSEQLLVLYLGRQYAEFSMLVPLMFMLSSVYSMAFFSQGALRSTGKFDVLAFHFLICAFCGAALMLVLFLLYGFYGVAVSLFVLKAPGILGYVYLRFRHKFGLLFDILFLSYFLLFIIFWVGVYFKVVV